MTPEEKLKSAATLLVTYGVYVPVPAGRGPCTLSSFLHEVLGLDPAYCEERIQTIMLDGFAVDRMATAMLKAGSRLALSAAMPGVVGATLRREGHYAPMRSAITLQENAPDAQALAADAERPPFWVELRCFNAIAAELALDLLRRGLAAPLDYIAGEGNSSSPETPLCPFMGKAPCPLPLAGLVWIKT